MSAAAGIFSFAAVRSYTSRGRARSVLTTLATVRTRSQNSLSVSQCVALSNDILLEDGLVAQKPLKAEAADIDRLVAARHQQLGHCPPGARCLL